MCAVVMRLFSNIEDLVLINEELLEELEQNAASKAPQLDQALAIGAIFLKMAFALILCAYTTVSCMPSTDHSCATPGLC